METLTQSLQNFYNTVSVGVASWGLKLLGALVALIVGIWIVNLLMKGIRRSLNALSVDETLKGFLATIINFTLKLLLFVSIAGVVGFDTTAFAALLAGAGLAVASALNGSLGHLASGVMLLIFKPFKVGDLIESNGTLGFVKEVSVFVTILETFQNKTVIIPNSAITSTTITNLSTKGNLRVDMPFGIRYGADVQKAKSIVENLLLNDPKVLKDPAPRVAVNNLGENGVELLALPYATTAEYWDVFWDTRQAILEALGNAGFEAPLPQRIVTMTSK